MSRDYSPGPGRYESKSCLNGPKRTIALPLRSEYSYINVDRSIPGPGGYNVPGVSMADKHTEKQIAKNLNPGIGRKEQQRRYKEAILKAKQ